MHLRSSLFAVSLLAVVPSIALAQNGPTNATPPTGGAGAGAPAASDTDAGEQKDGVRFRWGISAGGGGFFGSGVSAGLGGLDTRFGVQINNYLAIYGQPHVSFGAATVGRASGATGVASIDGIVELTLIDRLFVAAGGGAGVLNNPAGPDVHFRLGGYPLMGKGANGIRRHGLMVSADLRLFFLGTGYDTIVAPFFSIGYEAF